MSLQVWLPLNGNLINQGFANITVTTVGSTSYGDGQFVKGLTCNGASYWELSNVYLTSEATITWWAKTNTASKMPWVIVSDASDRLNIYTSTYYTLNTGDGNANLFQNNGANVSVLKDNIWHHFAVTFHNSQVKLYIDGLYKGTALTFRDPTNSNTGIVRLAGGYVGGHTYDWNGMLNDFRIYDTCLSIKEIKEIAKGLVLHYKLDNLLDTDTQVFDVSGFNNHGTIIGTATYEETTPKYNHCIHMNNRNTSNRVESNASLKLPTTGLTASFWFKTPTNVAEVLFATAEFCCGLNTAQTLIYTSVDTNVKTFNATGFKSNGWNHIVIQRTGTTYAVYLNGLALTQSSTSSYFIHNTSTLYLLNRSYNNNYGAIASLSDFRIYTTALSAADIQELYQTSASIDIDGNIYVREWVE